MGVGDLQNAFQYKQLSLQPGVSVNIGRAAGLLSIRNRSSNSVPSVYLIDNFKRTATVVAGLENPEISIGFDEKSDYDTTVTITNISSIYGEIHVAWQYI